jgi:hypothetical protein
MSFVSSKPTDSSLEIVIGISTEKGEKGSCQSLRYADHKGRRRYTTFPDAFYCVGKHITTHKPLSLQCT